MNCKFKDKCNNYSNYEKCNNECFAYVVLHGVNGKSGYWGNSRIPEKYKECTVDNLPIGSDNPDAEKVIKRYCSDFDKFVLDKGMGLFLFSIPNAENRLGTGTGKTTSAITILNEYLIHRVQSFIKNDFDFKDNPVMFLKLSELQNTYNSQFRGGFKIQEEASIKYYTLLKRMKTVELLVLDDIGIRDLSEPFKNELYDVIDTRVTNGLSTIYTSNYPLSTLADLLGERIVSRIEGQCYSVGFKGEDHRKGGLFR